MSPGTPDRADIALRTSSASANGGSCVQVGQHNGVFYLADSKHPNGPLVPVASNDYGTFITAIKTAPR